MKNGLIYGLGLLATLGLQPALAQRDSLQLKDLAMPAAPAFSLLDQAPSVADRPTSARAFTLGLFQTLDQKTGLPTNYAAELTPYWFVKHPTMSFYKFYGTNDDEPAHNGQPSRAAGQRRASYPWQLVPRSALSVAFVSPATAPAGTTTNSTTSTLSGGLRVPLFKLLRPGDLADLQAQTAQVVAGLAEVNAAFVRAHPESNLLAINDPPAYQKLLDGFIAAYKYQAKGNVADILSRRPLASLDLALAGSRYFPDQTYANNRPGRAGIWLTGNVALGFNQRAAGTKKGYVSLYLIGRYLSDQTLANIAQPGTYLDISYLDGGGKLELEFSRVSLGYEAVGRTVHGANQDQNPAVGNGWRSVGNLKYRIGDNVFITGAFGRNFGIRDNLLYALGINWNIQTGTEQAVASATP